MRVVLSQKKVVCRKSSCSVLPSRLIP